MEWEITDVVRESDGQVWVHFAIIEGGERVLLTQVSIPENADGSVGDARIAQRVRELEVRQQQGIAPSLSALKGRKGGRP